ncbi:MAG: dihydrofolate reductase [Cytophagales bacterium]|nr:MAG: dihydrofolate reductase [Cytophagales bacterium]
MRISIIAAKSINHVIGKNNQLPWRLPADLQYFKQITLHHHILMGRKTFESIGKPLPQRTSIILTRDKEFSKQFINEANIFVVDSLEKGIAIAQKHSENELFIIGGAETYLLAMPFADRLYITEVQTQIDGDAFFPAIDTYWQEITREKHLKDEKNLYDYDFVVYDRHRERKIIF